MYLFLVFISGTENVKGSTEDGSGSRRSCDSHRGGVYSNWILLTSDGTNCLILFGLQLFLLKWRRRESWKGTNSVKKKLKVESMLKCQQKNDSSLPIT